MAGKLSCVRQVLQEYFRKFSPVFYLRHRRTEDPCGFRPERDLTILSTFSMEMKRSVRTENDGAAFERCHLRWASARVVEREQQCVVSSSNPGGTIWSIDNGFDFLACEIAYSSTLGAFEWNR